MSETSVDLPAVQATITTLQDLSATLQTTAGQLLSGGDLGWTGADKTGVELHQQLNPAELASVETVRGAQHAVDGVSGNLAATAGIWMNTESTNVDLNG
jgi:hypothetical protein